MLYRGSDHPTAISGHPLSHISAQLASACTAQTECKGTYVRSSVSPVGPGFCDRWGKQQAVPCLVHGFSESSPGFCVFHSVSFSSA